MGKVMLEYNLPGDQKAFERAAQADKWAAVVHRFDDWLQELDKEVPSEMRVLYERVRIKFDELRSEFGVKE